MKKAQLAIYGGTPVRGTYLPYGRQSIDEEDIETVTNVLKSSFLTTGPSISTFEREIADYTGAKYAVAFANGTAALHGACFAAGIGEDDEVITTPMTFAASANCILYQKGKPVFADISPDTLNISPQSIQKCISKQTKAIIPVHFTGNPVELEEIQELATAHNLTVIEDAAHALGAVYKGKKIGSISDMTMFSFHPVKHITTGEGGVITTNQKELDQKLRQFRTHGITRDSAKLIENHGPWYYEMQFLGYNYRMTDIQAALGISQLKKLDRFIKRRREIVKAYTEAFAYLKELVLPRENAAGASSWHLYLIRLKLELLTCERKEVFTALQKENIGVNVHYIPVHLQPFYLQKGYAKGMYPVSEQVYEEIITLPLFPGMSEKDVEDVIQAVKKVLIFYRK